MLLLLFLAPLPTPAIPVTPHTKQAIDIAVSSQQD